MIFSSIQPYIREVILSFDEIPETRKEVLATLGRFIASKLKEGKKAEIVYICTHNSRRSHFGQIWGQVAAYYYGLARVSTYSGGTEATAFNANAIHSIEKLGFLIQSDGEKVNPHYTVKFNDEQTEITCFSKVYDDDFNPKSGFCAVMTCSEADENCPFVLGCEKRISTTYEDPKVYDGTHQQEEKYDERCRQIARETFYAFSLVSYLL